MAKSPVLPTAITDAFSELLSLFSRVAGKIGTAFGNVFSSSNQPPPPPPPPPPASRKIQREARKKIRAAEHAYEVEDERRRQLGEESQAQEKHRKGSVKERAQEQIKKELDQRAVENERRKLLGKESLESEEKRKKIKEQGGRLGQISRNTGITAFNSLIELFQKAVGVVDSFIIALSPNAMNVFNDSLRNLEAVIGQALLPIIQVFSDALLQLSGVLDPVAQQLAPIFQQLAEMFVSIFIPVVEAVAEILSALIPVFQAILDALKPLVDILKVVLVAFTLIVNAMRPIFEGLATVIRDVLIPAIQWLILQITKLATFVAVILGFGEAVDSLVKKLEQPEEKKDAVRRAAPQNIAIQGIQQIQKELDISAFGAGAGRVQDQKEAKEDAFRSTVIDAIKQTAAAANDILKEIRAWINAAKEGTSYLWDGITRPFELPAERARRRRAEAGGLVPG
jgi:hypothetical protein